MSLPELVCWVHDLESCNTALKSGADAVGLVVPFTRRGRAGFEIHEILSLADELSSAGIRFFVMFSGTIPQDDLTRCGKMILDAACSGTSGIALNDQGMSLIVQKSFPELPLFLNFETPVSTAGTAVMAGDLGYSRVIVSPYCSRDSVRSIIASGKTEIEYCLSWQGVPPKIIHPDWPFETQALDLSFSGFIPLREAGLAALSIIARPGASGCTAGSVQAARLLLDQGASALEEAVRIFHRSRTEGADHETGNDGCDCVSLTGHQNQVKVIRGAEKTKREEFLFGLVHRFRKKPARSSAAKQAEKITLRASLSTIEDYMDWMQPDNLVVDLDQESYSFLKTSHAHGLDKNSVVLAFPETTTPGEMHNLFGLIDELKWRGYRRWMIDSLDQLCLVQSISPQEIWIGWNMDIRNAAALSVFGKRGVTSVILPLTLDRREVETAVEWTAPCEPILCIHARPVLPGKALPNVPVEGEEAQFAVLLAKNGISMLVPRRPYSLTPYLHSLRRAGISHFLMDMRFEETFKRNPHGVIRAFQHASTEPGGTSLAYQGQREKRPGSKTDPNPWKNRR